MNTRRNTIILIIIIIITAMKFSNNEAPSMIPKDIHFCRDPLTHTSVALSTAKANPIAAVVGEKACFRMMACKTVKKSSLST